MSGESPVVRYADADGASIAYSVLGLGPIDVVRVPGVMSGIAASGVDPIIATHYNHLSRFARLILLDRRGLGMSDPLVAGGAPPLEQQVKDIIAVMDVVGSRQAALYGGADGGLVALMFAAMHPDRTSALVLNSAWARLFRSADHPHGIDSVGIDERRALNRSRWGDVDDPWGYEFVAPSRLNDPNFRGLLARVQQVSASRAAASEARINAENDLRSVLPLVQAPTLVLCGADPDPISDWFQLLDQSRFLADHIPNARLRLFPGADGYFGVHTPEIGALIEEFLTGTRPVPLTDRILATVLFTDIVASTERLAELGDQEWRAQLDRHDAMVRTHLERFRGREINTAGDGFFATFDGPARAVHCAQSIAAGAGLLGIDLRAGVHVGECEVRGDDLAGIAVHIAARVCALAQAGEVLATSTVRDLVAGSGIKFTERGYHTLKGVPGEWTILAANV